MLGSTWFLATRFDLVEELLLPSPQSVAVSLRFELSNAVFWQDLTTTLTVTALAFLAGAIAGIPLGAAMGRLPQVDAALQLPVDLFRSLPVVLLFPVVIMILGVRAEARFALGAFASALVLIVDSGHATRDVSPARIEAARLMGMSRAMVFVRVILRESIGSIIAGSRIAFSLCLAVVVVTEMLMGAQAGMGKRVYEAALSYKMGQFYADALALGVAGYFGNRLLVLVGTRLSPWLKE